MKFAEMTFPQIHDVPRDTTVVLAPIAACEQHSRHLPTITDTVLVTAVAEGAEKQLSQQVLLLPTLWLGASSHHLRFGATLSAEVDTHMQILCDLLKPLLNDGFPRLLVLNGHGGNVDPMKMALRLLQTEHQRALLTGASYWELASDELASLAAGPRKEMGHACEFETSMMLALRPELVQQAEIKDDPPRDDPALKGLYLSLDMWQRTDHGSVGYAEQATAARGQACLDTAIRRTTEVIQALLRHPLPQ
jgi:creatinine amidohydrolase